jgi:hypothetical protein
MDRYERLNLFGIASSHYQALSFGLTKSGVLFANERILVRNCTSFVVTPAHLIFTTTQHLLKFVHLTSIDGECFGFGIQKRSLMV